jgi:hypothetical protein
MPVYKCLRLIPLQFFRILGITLEIASLEQWPVDTVKVG